MIQQGRSESQLVIIDPAMHTPEIDCFNNLSRLSPFPVTYHLPAMCGLASLRDHEKQMTANHWPMAGIIVLGSASSVNDAHPWQIEIGQWLKTKIDAGIPFFGFCFGHQLLAHIYGAKIDFVSPDQEKLKGFDSVEICNSRIFEPGPTKLLRSHREMVTTAPEGFHVFAKSPRVAVDGLEHDTLPIWSVQTHPETTAQFLRNQEITSPEPLVHELPELDPQLAPGWKLIQTFLRQLK